MSTAKMKELKQDIEDYKKVLSSASAQQDEKDFAKEMLAEAEAELRGLEAVEKAGKEKAEPEKKEKKESKPRERVAPKPKTEKKEAKGKEEPSCDDLLKAWQERRAAAKKSAKKAKTRSVFAVITDKIEDAVTKAIKTVPAADIKADPKKAIGKFEKLEESMQKFLHDFRSILGDDYKASEVTDAVKHIEDLIKKLKARYEKK